MGSLQFRPKASQHLGNSGGLCGSRFDLGIALGCQGIPCRIASAIGIKAFDHAIKQLGANFRRQLEDFLGEGFEGVSGARHADLLVRACSLPHSVRYATGEAMAA